MCMAGAGVHEVGVGMQQSSMGLGGSGDAARLCCFVLYAAGVGDGLAAGWASGL